MIKRLAAAASGIVLTALASGGAGVPWLASPAAASSAAGGTTATAAPLVRLTPRVGPPTTRVTVRGSGFAAYETVDVYFDTKDEALASTSAAGSFTTRVTVPASALPGRHWVTGNGRRSKRSAQAPFTVRANWPQFHRSPDRRGYNVTENVLSPATVPGMDQDWSYPTGGQSSPAVANGTVYIGSDDDHVYALNAATGAKEWSHRIGGNGFGVESSPAVANGTVYVGSMNDRVYALNAATGAKEWSYATGDWVQSSPAVANGTVYVGSQDGRVYALNAATGALKWRYATGGIVYSSPAVANGVVYVSSDDDRVYALNAATGALKWSYATGYHVSSSPAVANGVVYVGSFDHHLYALNAATGARHWSYASGSVVWSSPAVANGVVYVASDRVYAFGLPGGMSGGTHRPDPATLRLTSTSHRTANQQPR